jgi:hypothetical protein
MADNVGYTPGSGATVAADDIGGVLYQRIKPTFGADGSAVDVSSANPMPVVDATAEDTRQSMVTRYGCCGIRHGHNCDHRYHGYHLCDGHQPFDD